MLHLNDLEPEQRLTLAIGTIIRNDNLAESEAGAVFRALTAPGLGGATAPRDFGRILEGCRDMVKAANELNRLDEHRHELALDVLTAARNAHDQRNTLAHDIWIRDPSTDEESWQGLRATSSSQRTRRRDARQPVESPGRTQRPTIATLDEFVDCGSALKRARWRLRALWILLPGWLSNPNQLDLPEEEYARWTHVAEGHFSISATTGTPEVTPRP